MEKYIQNWKVPALRSKDEAWEMLRKKMASPKKLREKKISPAIWTVAAAAVLVLAYLAVSEWMIFSHPVSNTTASRLTVWLPDSSRVEMKAYSEMRYKYRRNGERIITMEGEAFFDVKPGHTFKVGFPGGQLQVLGTSFTIRAYSEESGRIDCFNGKIRLFLHQKELTLGQGQSVIFDDASVEGPFISDPNKILSLPDNTYLWLNRPLKEILMLICQREKLQLDAPENILSLHFSGELNLGRVDQALQIMATAMHFRYQVTNHKLRILEKE